MMLNTPAIKYKHTRQHESVSVEMLQNAQEQFVCDFINWFLS